MLSVVIPVYNEADSLEALHGELVDVARAEGYELDIIFVDDGSTDESWSVMRGIAQSDDCVQAIRFRRNFGKAAALDAGFSAARGELIMTLDADLQDDPHEIPRFLARMEDGYDVVSGWKKVRYDPWHKVGPSRVFNWMVSRMTGVYLHDHNCGMKCYRREIFDEVRLYGELHRFVPVLAAARGFRPSEIVISHRTRKFGESKYGVSRIVKGFLDLLTVKFITGFGQRPQHVLGTVGMASFALGFFGLFYLTASWFITRLVPGLEDIHLHQRPAVIYSVGLLLLGAQFMSIGFLGELILAFHQRDIRSYSISERTDELKQKGTEDEEKTDTEGN